MTSHPSLLNVPDPGLEATLAEVNLQHAAVLTYS